MVRIYRPDGTWIDPAMKALVKPAVPPFDPVRGELIETLGNDYVVVPVSKWMDTPVIEMAWERARTAMKGYRLSQEQAQFLVQEYHGLDQLLVLVAVWGKANGKGQWQWHFTPTVIDIKGPTKASMVLAGRWPAGRTTH